MTFFSGTDEQELNDSVAAYLPGYYLSLIVNHSNQWQARVVYLIQEEVSPNFTGKIQNSFGTGDTVDVTISAERTPRQVMVEIELDVVVPNAANQPVLPNIIATVGDAFMYNGQLLKIASNENGVLTVTKEEVETDDASFIGRITYLDEVRKKRTAYQPYRSTGVHHYQNQYHHNNGGETDRFRQSQTYQEGTQNATEAGLPAGTLSHDKCLSFIAKCLTENLTYDKSLSKALVEFVNGVDRSLNNYSIDPEKYVDMRNDKVCAIWSNVEAMIPYALIENFGLENIRNYTKRVTIINGIKSAATSFKKVHSHASIWESIINEFCSNDNLGSFISHQNITPFIEAYTSGAGDIPTKSVYPNGELQFNWGGYD